MPWLRSTRSYTIANAVLVTPDRVMNGSIRIAFGKIASLDARVSPEPGNLILDAEGACVYPGLINAHDHLELDLFPRVGQGPYPNSYVWFDDVNRQRDTPAMARVLAVPVKDRLRWGGYRNLFSGVTTVAHHNPYHRRIFDRGFPVRVLRRYRWSHSLKLAGAYGGRPEVESKRTEPGEPFILHLAEGVDEVAAAELTQLDRLEALKANTVVVHGVGLTAQDRALMRERGAGLVWCPSSNLFLFDRTADIPALVNRIPIALGTDSTLTGPFTLFDELRTADGLGYTDPRALVRMVTTVPARMLGLAECAGRLTPGRPADLLMLERTTDDPYRNLIAATPATVKLVTIDGRPRFGDPAFENMFQDAGGGYAPVVVEDTEKLVAGPCNALVKRLCRTLGDGLPIPISVWFDGTR